MHVMVQYSACNTHNSEGKNMITSQNNGKIDILSNMLFPGFDLSMGGEMWYCPFTNSILGSIKGPF